jgi:hypothetical protein
LAANGHFLAETAEFLTTDKRDECKLDENNNAAKPQPKERGIHSACFATGRKLVE